MPSINTVTGPIPADALGVTLMHEHIICSSPVMMSEFGDKWFEREAVIELAGSKVRQAKERHGVQSIIDATPLNLARDIPLLAEVSRRSGVNIIAATGMYYLDDFAFWKVPPEIMAEYFVEECRSGIRDSGIRPAVLKCAVEAPQISNSNRNYLEIMAIAQKATGLPIIAHSRSATRNGLLMMDFFHEHGVDPARIIIGHCLDSCDVGYVRELLARGCYVGCDRIYRHDGSLPKRIELMAQLISDGWGHRMVLSHDFICYPNHLNRRQRLASRPASVHDDPLGLCVVHELVIPALLARGVTADDIEQMTRRNPLALLTVAT
ncbi:MAG: hypothetical protein GX945_15040 [Lentisphaerae bacterium]|jgi:phosphotriesterase-related protein|nr:hypothetical protein [Lentisphaerota bacterium]